MNKRKVPRTGYCQAVVSGCGKYQVDYAQICQQKAVHNLHGIGLCGTHLNAWDRNLDDLVIITHMPTERTVS